MVSQGTGWHYHLHLSTGSLHIGHRGFSVRGTSCQYGVWPVRGQGMRRSPCDDGLRFAWSQSVVTYNWTTEKPIHLSYCSGSRLTRGTQKHVLIFKFNMPWIFVLAGFTNTNGKYCNHKRG